MTWYRVPKFWPGLSGPVDEAPTARLAPALAAAPDPVARRVSSSPEGAAGGGVSAATPMAGAVRPGRDVPHAVHRVSDPDASRPQAGQVIRGL